jgi:hypothetical protein
MQVSRNTTPQCTVPGDFSGRWADGMQFIHMVWEFKGSKVTARY